MKKKQIKNLSLKKFTVSKLNNLHMVMGGAFNELAFNSRGGSCSLKTARSRGSRCCTE